MISDAPDNLDLQIRRKRAGLSQSDVARALGLMTAKGYPRPAYVSDFENGNADLPHGLTRDDYERVLDEAEREAGAA